MHLYVKRFPAAKLICLLNNRVWTIPPTVAGESLICVNFILLLWNSTAESYSFLRDGHMHVIM